eukprot:7495-Heterococcus_DN1.PRE.2
MQLRASVEQGSTSMTVAPLCDTAPLLRAARWPVPRIEDVLRLAHSHHAADDSIVSALLQAACLLTTLLRSATLLLQHELCCFLR